MWLEVVSGSAQSRSGTIGETAINHASRLKLPQWHRPWKRRTSELGASPLTLERPRTTVPTKVFCRVYDTETHVLHEKIVPAGEGQIRWIDISGLADTELVATIARGLGISDLAIAELFHIDQRPHTEIEDDLLITVLRMPVGEFPFEADQITLVLGDDFILTVREGPRDCLDAVRRRLANGAGNIRSSSAYLFYAISDAITDKFFPVLEHYGDIVEELEERVIEGPQDGSIRDIHLLKRELISIRHSLWPMREALAALLREDTPQIGEDLHPYLRDCGDHAFQLLDMVEVYRETAQGLVDLHLSSLSNRMNEVMKVLAMIATIFIPMTFIAGIYGMNFNPESPYNLPELKWKFGYFYALALMGASAATTLVVFWRLGWIFNHGPVPRRPRENSP